MPRTPMKVEMHPYDAELILTANEGRPLSKYALEKYLRIKKRLLLMGSAGQMSKELLATICEVSLASAEVSEPVLVLDEPQQVVTGPSEEEAVRNPEEIAFTSSQGAGEYTGPLRAAPQKSFKSKPGDPWRKVEKGRPLMYLSDKLASWQAGRFVKVDPLDKTRIIVSASEMKKNFGVPSVNVQLTDLSPLSTTPLPVQI